METPKGEHLEPEIEKREQLQNAVQILKETAEKFNSLENEAELALVKKDLEAEEAKLKERAQLLVDLPDRLAQALEEVEEEIKQEILLEATHFATQAKEALESKTNFGLYVLLTRKGDEIGEKNSLERLIESLEQK